MKLYQFPHSSYCIPISLILKNGGIKYEDVLVPNWDRSIVSKLTNGAYYQVPVIEHDGNIIYESSDTSLDVAKYVNKLISLDLFPHRISGIHEVLIDHIESTLEGIGFKTTDPDYIEEVEDIVDRTNIIRHKERRFGRGCVDNWRKNKEILLSEFYAHIDNFKGTLETNLYLFGELPVYADYALYGVIGNVHYIPANVWMEDRDWLRQWMNRLSQLRVQ